MNYFKALSKISKTAYFIIFMIFVMRVGQFMSLPFLAIYLTKNGFFTPSEIGFILGIAGFVLSVTGLFNGIYIDRNSQRKILMISLCISAFCYFGFTFSLKSFYALLLLNASLGWLRSLIEISAISLLVQHTKPENIGYTYSVRFVAANLGIVIGPLIGALMVKQQSLLIFYVAGSFHLILAISMFFYKETVKTIEKPSKPKLYENFQEIFRDKTLINIMFVNLILWTVYSQLDTTLPQYLAKNHSNSAILFSAMLVVNAAVCIILQPFALHWAEVFSYKKSAILGSLLFSFAFLFLAIKPTTLIMFISVAMMSLAELFTLPINGVLILRIAPKHLVASYNGFLNFGMLGLSIGPILGGYGLRFIPGSHTFIVSAFLPLLALMIYFNIFRNTKFAILNRVG